MATINPKFHKYLEREVITSESKYVLEPEYLHLHENDINVELRNYNLLQYLFRFIESIPDLKEELDSLVCCYSFEKESNTPHTKCERKKFYYFKFTDFNWRNCEDFLKKYEAYNPRPKLISFEDEMEGLVSLLKDSDLLQPYILKEKNKSVEPIFSILTKPKANKIQESLNQFLSGNSYQAAWYGFKFKTDKARYWTQNKDGIDQLHILSVGFIFHVIQWNYELKKAHETTKTIEQLEFQTLINISSHVIKTAIKTGIISEIETIKTKQNAKELEKLERNSQHLFVLAGIVNLLTKIYDIPAFKKTAENDKLLVKSKVDWGIKKLINDYSNNFFKRKGYKIISVSSTNIPYPNIQVHDLFFSDHLIKSFFNTLLENIELHGYDEDYQHEPVYFVKIEKKAKEWIFSNRAKEEFKIDSHKLTGNLLFYKSLIELTNSGQIDIDCKKENDEIIFSLKITTK